MFKEPAMRGNWMIESILREYRYKLLLTYSLYALEMLGLLLRPWLLGEAVNGLLQQSYNGLLNLALVHAAWLLIGTWRHRYDSRTYSEIYTALVVKMVKRNPNRKLSRLSAHSTLSRDVVDFLEFDLNYIIEAAYNILGALILLFFYDTRVVLLCMAMLLPVTIISYFYGKRLRRFTALRNEELEQQVDALSSRNILRIQTHYNQLRKWQVKISDQEAWNFGVMELIVLALITVTLLVSTRQGGIVLQPGDYIGIYTYILKFVTGLDTIPYVLQRMTHLKDILQRVQQEHDETETEPAFSSVA
jgi:ABC-type multidrug transport system fused ATPase/permease subunit